MKLNPSYDADNNALVFKIEVGFLDKYFGNLKGMIEMSKDLPENIEVEKTGKNEAHLIIKLDIVPDIQDRGNGMGIIGIPDSEGKIRALHKLINTFINSGIRKELSTTEFIPLRGYPREDLRKDVKAAVENNRSLCLIKDYAEYLKSQDSKQYKYTQYIISPGTEEWVDVVCEILSDMPLTQIEKKYKPLLEVKDWL